MHETRHESDHNLMSLPVHLGLCNFTLSQISMDHSKLNVHAFEVTCTFIFCNGLPVSLGFPVYFILGMFHCGGIEIYFDCDVITKLLLFILLFAEGIDVCFLRPVIKKLAICCKKVKSRKHILSYKY